LEIGGLTSYNMFTKNNYLKEIQGILHYCRGNGLDYIKWDWALDNEEHNYWFSDNGRGI
jgi:hypothetical protein